MNGLQKWDPFKDWDPFRELSEFQQRLGSMIARRDEPARQREWMPAVDIIEDEKEFCVKAELPEVRKQDVHVTVENGVLTLHGERKFEKEEKQKRYHRIERSYGSFTRSFALPEGADAGKVRAEFKDGLLQVHLPKSEAAKPKHVEVKVD